MRKYHFLWAAYLLLVLSSCKKQEVDNPFDVYNNSNDSTHIAQLDPNTIEGIYYNVFKPTCANSGCHDGTFEPDFRTIESSYNTLVFHPIIKNDTTDPLVYRVQPGNSGASMLIYRLTVDLYGNSGTMPLVVDPGSSWETKKTEYIQNIRNWIDGGAKDVFGNPSVSIDKKPQIAGMQIRSAGGSTNFNRNTEGVVQIPAGTNNIDIYLCIQDDLTASTDFGVNNLQLSLSQNNFTDADNYSMSNASISTMGYSGSTISYTHKISISNIYSVYGSGTKVFMNIQVQDATNDVSNLPGRYAQEYIKNYYSFELQ